MKQQVVVINGGDAFDKYEDYLDNLKKARQKILLEHEMHTAFLAWKQFPFEIGYALGVCGFLEALVSSV